MFTFVDVSRALISIGATKNSFHVFLVIYINKENLFQEEKKTVRLFLFSIQYPVTGVSDWY